VLEAIRAWAEQNQVIALPAEQARDRLPGILPERVEGEVLAGPLNTENEPVGVLILVTQAPRTFRPEHQELLQALLEPFAVALENDHRVRELTSLREAVEADNRSLLSRLGRHDIVDSIVGAETGLKPVMAQIELVARSDAPVLVLGETGSGKEVVARAIHSRSRRASGPFLRVNCGAIPPELVDSELFGHEKGSFTGAVNIRKGWFERADGGTLFLDECGELPLAAQVRLLRILQDGTFERVGGERQLTVDVRIVAATHRDLQALVSAGRFREDLWYRIAVFPIRLPPLRERKDDIPALAAHFTLRAARRLGTVPLVPLPEDLNLLIAYPWPGNVRELAAVIERAAILGDGKRLEMAQALGGAPQRLATGAKEENSGDGSREKSAEPTTLDAAMIKHIEAALARTHGRVEGPFGAAALLQINPHTLRARMRKLKIDWKKFRSSPAALGP
ncbi:MAG TPA: sigma 54-interacting transcriptional regulator, partial [Gemmataceae bacterium]|nr:sigma 54-interacting transcriptional regulator [Gemmataceae bacterium]